MALTAPSSTLTAQTVSASFDQLLYLDSASGLVEATLKVVSTEVGKSAVQLDDERLLVAKKHIDGPLGVAGRNSDNKLIKEKIGWAPNYPLSKGIEKTYKWIKLQLEDS